MGEIEERTRKGKWMKNIMSAKSAVIIFVLMKRKRTTYSEHSSQHEHVCERADQEYSWWLFSSLNECKHCRLYCWSCCEWLSLGFKRTSTLYAHTNRNTYSLRLLTKIHNKYMLHIRSLDSRLSSSTGCNPRLFIYSFRGQAKEECTPLSTQRAFKTARI